MNNLAYQRLPGTGSTLGSYTRLYQGADHLLQTSVAAFSERYKRFYFRDIQAFIVVRTQTWIWQLSLTGAAALVLIAAALFAGDAIATGLLAGAAAVFGAFAVYFAMAGPSCRCYVRTLVQTERIPSLSRLRRANKVLAQLDPLIVAAQDGNPAPAPSNSPLPG